MGTVGCLDGVLRRPLQLGRPPPRSRRCARRVRGAALPWDRRRPLDRRRPWEFRRLWRVWAGAVCPGGQARCTPPNPAAPRNGQLAGNAHHVATTAGTLRSAPPGAHRGRRSKVRRAAPLHGSGGFGTRRWQRTCPPVDGPMEVCWADFVLCCANARSGRMVVEIRPNSGHVRSKSPKLGRSPASFGQHRAERCRSRSKSGRV